MNVINKDTLKISPIVLKMFLFVVVVVVVVILFSLFS